MKRILSVAAVSLLCAHLLPVSAQPGAALPLDPALTKGRLPNGVTYYVRTNRKPEKRAELRLVVNAGSVLENNDQQGLAHFVEHMAFNGTKNFRRQELVNYLESVGVRFGADLNAYTSFDETVYMLQIPTDSTEIVEKAFDILEDWAHQISFEDSEIDKERGVVVEEWRQGRGAGARIRDKQLPIIFKNSRYADRLPIGKKETIEHFPHESLVQFYRDWYRPELTAVIAVGDFDPGRIESLIRKHFSVIPNTGTARQREVYPVPEHRETLYAIATDPEMTVTGVSINFKLDASSDSSETDYRRSLIESLAIGMFNDRLNERTRQADPPFLFASSSKGSLVRSRDIYSLNASVKEDGVERGLAALVTETARVRTFGFTATELERQKKDMLRSIERAYQERDKSESSGFASEYVRNFLVAEASPGIAYEYELHRRLLPGIAIDEVNRLSTGWITDRNRVVTVSAPEKPGSPTPVEADLARLIDSVSTLPVQAYLDSLSSQPLVPVPPTPGTLVAQKEIREIGITEWTLSNGARVILKPTDFKNDEVLLSAYSPGGSSLAPDSIYIPASTASSVVSEGGLGRFDRISLQKALAGKIAGVAPFIGELEEGISGSASPQDLATMFQMLYLTFTAPRMDSLAFTSYRTRLRGLLQNRDARPEASFDDTILVTMSQRHPRRRPFTVETLNALDLRKSFAFYRDRFADAGDFTFIFVGSFVPDEIRPLILTYIGGLPALHRTEQWKDIGLRPPSGIVTKQVRRGVEQKSQVRIIFSGPFIWSPENRHILNALGDILRMKLREALREEKGGTYGVGVSAFPVHYPRPEYRINLAFGCSPERVEELTRTAMEQIDSLRRFGPDEQYIGKVKETLNRERETNLKQNRFWLSALQSLYTNGEPPTEILQFELRLRQVTRQTIMNAARQYCTEQNYVRVIMYPETEKK